MFIRLDLLLQFRGFSFTHIVMIWIELVRKLDPVLCFICAHHGHGRHLVDVAVEHGLRHVPQLARRRQREQVRKRPAEHLLPSLASRAARGQIPEVHRPDLEPMVAAPTARPKAQ